MGSSGVADAIGRTHPTPDGEGEIGEERPERVLAVGRLDDAQILGLALQKLGELGVEGLFVADVVNEAQVLGVLREEDAPIGEGADVLFGEVATLRHEAHEAGVHAVDHALQEGVVLGVDGLKRVAEILRVARGDGVIRHAQARGECGEVDARHNHADGADQPRGLQADPAWRHSRLRTPPRPARAPPRAETYPPP